MRGGWYFADVTNPVSQSVLEEVVSLATAAGQRTLKWFGTDSLGIDNKGDGTPVTDADRDAERFVREYLADHHPDDSIVGEEEADTIGTSGRRWIVDPIDGTKAFTKGVPLYSTLVALEDEHGPAVGVIAVPALDQVVFAGRGLGCFFNDAPAQVSDTAVVKDAYVTTSGFGPWSPDALARIHAAEPKLRTWGDAYGYTLVATGRADAMVDPIASLWDLAPMPVILDEAGGRFSSLADSEGADHGSGVATNGHIHAEVLTLMDQNR